jgi:hypothetical protein
MRDLRGIRRIGGAAVTCATIALCTVTGAAPASARPRPDVLLSGLSSPKGLTIDIGGNPIVAQGAFGPPGPVLAYTLHGRGHGSTEALTADQGVIDIAATSDDQAWAIGGDRSLYHADAGGTVTKVLHIPRYQKQDPDPVDQDDFATESNPYGLVALPSGDALVTDAANNDLLRVTPAGDVTTVARFDLETVSTDHLPPGYPPTLTAEAVPTTVAIGPDGWAYVGELKGFPFRPGTSHVWRVDPGDHDAFCSVNTPDPACTVVAEGFTAIEDIAFNQHNGALYVYELAADGVLAYEEGLQSGDFPPAVLLKVMKDRRTELAAGQLSQPGGVAVAHDGTVFVTDGVFSDGRLVRVRG